jgi:hypothetical protein
MKPNFTRATLGGKLFERSFPFYGHRPCASIDWTILGMWEDWMIKYLEPIDEAYIRKIRRAARATLLILQNDFAILSHPPGPFLF